LALEVVQFETMGKNSGLVGRKADLYNRVMPQAQLQFQSTQDPHFIRIELPGQDLIEAQETSGLWSIKSIGCSALQHLIQILQAELAQGKKPSNCSMPTGNDHSSILVRELILRMRGDFKFPLEQEELCHCRAITTHTVDQAIIAGAHDIATVRRWTSANTACGTCMPEVETLLQFRLINS
jgi:bacterioferritin-associated ferredoxin